MENTFTDDRDGHVYRTVKIGNQIWMAENMAIKLDDSYSPNGDYKNIQKYGRLYTWRSAQKACPPGWHLPTIADFESLLKASGSNDNKVMPNPAFLALVAKDDLVWDHDYKNQVTNSIGFSALPAGYYYAGDYDYDDSCFYGGGYYRFGQGAYFWTGENYGSRFCNYYLGLGNGNAYVDEDDEASGHSVRCIKD